MITENMRFQKALLIVPPTGLYIREDRCQTPIEELVTVAPRPPIDLMYMAAVLEKAGVECRIMDCPVEERTWNDYENQLRKFKPGAVFISITTPTLAQDLLAATIAKRDLSEVLTIAKGPHFHFRDKITLEAHRDLDVAIRGEYEQTAGELASDKDFNEIMGITYRQGDEIHSTADRPFIPDLDSLPFPARHLIGNELYRRPDIDTPQTTIVVSRGCPFKCVFCLSRVVAGTRPRLRSPENIIEEVQQCVSSYGIRDFLFRSDTFTANRKWLMEFCEALIESNLNIRWACNSRVDTLNREMLEKMETAGCWLIAFGIESGSQEILDTMKKGISKDQVRQALKLTRSEGIKSSIYFLLGLPWETQKTFRETIDFAKELSPDFIEFFYTYPFEGTDLYDICVENGLLDPANLPESSYSRPAYATNNFTLEQLAQQRPKALRAFYLRPGYIISTLWKAKSSPSMLLNYLRYGWKQFQFMLKR